MSIDKWAAAAIGEIDERLENLLHIAKDLQAGNTEIANRNLEVWKSVTVGVLAKRVKPSEVSRLKTGGRPYHVGLGKAQTLSYAIKDYRSILLSIKGGLENYPEHLLLSAEASQEPTTEAGVQTQKAASHTVFIVHGHDELNQMKLAKMLKDRWNLSSIVIKNVAAKGRTLIQMIEDEGSKASYAIAIMTPDDTVNTGTGDYTQARPNVAYELGWFHARLGRERVCLLVKRGTQIHSDLQGIRYIEFRDSVEEIVGELERELEAAELVRGNDDRRATPPK